MTLLQFYDLVEQLVLDTCLVVSDLVTPLKSFEGESTRNTDHPEAANIFRVPMATPSAKNPVFIMFRGIPVAGLNP